MDIEVFLQSFWGFDTKHYRRNLVNNIGGEAGVKPIIGIRNFTK